MNISSVDDEMAKMKLDNIPNNIMNKTQEELSSEENPVIIAKSDLDLNGYFKENWLIVSEKTIYIFTINTQQDEHEDEKIECKKLSLENIEDALIKRYVGNAFLQVKIDGEYKNLLRFSLSYIQRFEWIASKLEQMIGEKEVETREKDIEEADLEDMTKERLEYEDRCPGCGRKLPSGMEYCPKCIDKQKLFKRMFKYLLPYWKKALLGLILLWSVTALNQAPPIISRYMIDDVLPPAGSGPDAGNLDLFIWLVAGLAFVYIFRSIFAGIRTYIIQWVGNKITLDLRSKVYAHIQQLSINYYDTTRTGKIMNRVTTDTRRLKDFLVNGLQQTLNHVFTLIFIIIILFSHNWRLALMALSPIPLIVVMTIVFANKIHLIYHRIWRRVGDMKAILGDTIPGIKVVKAFTKENEEINKFDDQLNEVFGEQVTAAKTRSIFRPAMTLATAIGAMIVWGYGGWLVFARLLTAGTLIMFVQYMHRFYNPVRALARLSGRFERAITSAERIFNILDLEPEADEYDRKNITLDESELNGKIEFDNVSFRYEGEDEEVLQNIDAKVEPGQTVGLVGPTGAGKTTFVNLIPRFYEVNKGKIKLDGRDLRDYDIKWLRRQIGVVPQHPFLFYGSIAQNIAYGIEDAKREDIIKAAKMANAHEFIMDFPMGYDTHVGERGIGLSGGERQRVSIARAILKNAKIMILDEATSAVDTETENKIQNAIDRLIEGRTTFVIAHRLSTLKNADKLIVIEDGKIVEEGSHEELLNKEDGLFKKLWDMQTSVQRLEV